MTGRLPRLPAALAAALSAACAVWAAGQVLSLDAFTHASLLLVALGYLSAAAAHWRPVAILRAVVLAALGGLAYSALRAEPPAFLVPYAEVLLQKSSASLLIGLVFAVVFLSFVAGASLRGRHAPMVVPAVPALSIYGLAGVFSTGFGVQASFLGFLFGAVYAMAYEHVLSQEPIPPGPPSPRGRGVGEPGSNEAPAIRPSPRATGRAVGVGASSHPPSLQGRGAGGVRPATTAAGFTAGYLALLLPLAFPLTALSQHLTAGLTPAERDDLRRVLFSTGDDPGYSRLSETVGLAGGVRSSGEQPLMRVRTSAPGLLRGRVYDVYDTGSWSRSSLIGSRTELAGRPRRSAGRVLGEAMRRLREPDDLGGEKAPYGPRRRYPVRPPRHLRPPREHTRRVTQEIHVVGKMPGSACCAGVPLEVRTTRLDLVADTTGVVFGEADWQPGDDYTVISEVADVPEALLRKAPGGTPPEEGYWSQIPTSVAPIREVALEAAGKERTPYARAEAIADYLDAHCRYSLSVPATPRDEDPVVHFVTTGRRGACDLFAGATAVLCRSVGVPARLATGYLLGEPEADGTHLVRERDAHAWVEVYTSPYGWVPLDPTPGSNAPAGQSAGRAFLAWWSKLDPRALAFLAEALLLAILCGAVVCARGTRRPPDPAARFRPDPSDARSLVQHAYHQACRHLARRGVPRLPEQTAAEYLGAMGSSGLPVEVRERMGALTRLFERACYGPAGPALTDADMARALAAGIRKLPARWKRSLPGE